MATLLMDLLNDNPQQGMVPVKNIEQAPKKGLLDTLGQNFSNSGYTKAGVLRDILSGFANSKADTWTGMFADAASSPFQTQQLKNTYNAMGYNIPQNATKQQIELMPELLKSSLDRQKLASGIKLDQANMKRAEAMAEFYKNKPQGSSMFGGSKNAYLSALEIANDPEKFNALTPELQDSLMLWLDNQAKNPNALYNQEYAKNKGQNKADIQDVNTIEFNKAQGKLQGEKGLAAEVEYEKQTAKDSAKAYQDDLDNYLDMASKMPQIVRNVDRLNQLADTATYTELGKLTDSARRQLGLPVGTGATARAEYIAIIDNQILPLLRNTFGAQFTEREGQTLRATLGDVNKSPAERKAILKSFVNQKMENIDALGQKIRMREQTYNSNPAPKAKQNASGYQQIGRFKVRVK